MAINLQEKKSVVKHLGHLADAALSMLLVEYRGLKTPQITALRVEVHRLGIHMVVARHTLVRFALQETKHSCLISQLCEQPLFLLFSKEDPGVVARLIQDFLKKHKEVKVKALSVGGHFFVGEQLAIVASLPSYDQALALLMQTMLAPAQKLTQTMTEVYGKLVRTVNAVCVKKQQQ